MRNMPLSFVQYMWDMNMGISFMVGREAARRIVPKDDADAKIPCGTLIFTVICGVCACTVVVCVCESGEGEGGRAYCLQTQFVVFVDSVLLSQVHLW